MCIGLTQNYVHIMKDCVSECWLMYVFITVFVKQHWSSVAQKNNGSDRLGFS